MYHLPIEIHTWIDYVEHIDKRIRDLGDEADSAAQIVFGSEAGGKSARLENDGESQRYGTPCLLLSKTAVLLFST